MNAEEEKTSSTEPVTQSPQDAAADGASPSASSRDATKPGSSSGDAASGSSARAATSAGDNASSGTRSGDAPGGSSPRGGGSSGGEQGTSLSNAAQQAASSQQEARWQAELRERLEQVPEVQELDARSLRRRLQQRVERLSKRFGIRQILRLTVYQPRVRETLEEVPKRMQLVTNQARLVLELIEDFVQGRYRAIPWHSVAVAAAALVYSVSPTDVFPDFIPVVGALDDMVVLSLAMRVVQKDLRAYCDFKGYPASDYFELS